MLNAWTGHWAPEDAGEDHAGFYPESDEEHPEVTLERLRAAAHAGYLSLPSHAPPSIVGTYIVDCEEIERDYHNTDDLGLSITSTPLPGIYQATFDFGILEGVMMLSADEYMLSYFSEKKLSASNTGTVDAGSASEVGSDIKVDKEAQEVLPPAVPKRKSYHELPLKEVKIESDSSGSSAPIKLHLCMRSRDRSGEINPIPDLGTATANADFTVLTAKADMVCVGQGVPFRARKISDTPEWPSARWEDYGYAASDYACSARW